MKKTFSFAHLSTLTGVAMAVSAISMQKGDAFVIHFGGYKVDPDAVDAGGPALPGVVVTEGGAAPEGGADTAAAVGPMKKRGNNCCCMKGIHNYSLPNIKTNPS